MAVYVARTKQGVALYSSSSDQRIYNVNDILVGSDTDVRKELESLGKRPKLDDIVERLAGKDAYVAADSFFGTKVISTRTRKEVPRNTLTGTAKGNKAKISEKAGELGDALGTIYKIDGGSKSMQLGLIIDGKAKTLYSGLRHDALGRSDAKKEYETRIASEITKILERISYAKRKDMSRWAEKKLGHKITEILEGYDCYSWIPGSKAFGAWNAGRIRKQADDVDLRKISDRITDGFGAMVSTVRKNIGNYGDTVQQELDRMFHSKKRQDIIIGLGKSDRRIRAEMADELSRVLGAQKYIVFDSIPYIAVPCEAKDVDKVCYQLSHGSGGHFGPSMSVNNSLIRSAQRSRGIYIPELFEKAARDMKISLPYSRLRAKKSDGRWNLDLVGAYKARDITSGNNSTVVVIDTGIEYTHPEVRACFGSDKGWNFVNDSDDPMDDQGHGTHCAGIVAGQTTGVAPSAALIAAKALDARGTGTNTDIIYAIDYAIKLKQADVISMSLGGSYPSDALDEICYAAYKSGMIVCAAAGNDYFGPHYPSACRGVISVAAIDRYKKHADFSNIDGSVDISAPGVDIYSSYLGGGYRTCSGTSMATPHVAGVAGLAVSVRNTLDPKDFEDIMGNVAEKIGSGESQRNEKYGKGLARADKIVTELHDSMFEPAIARFAKKVRCNYGR